MQKNVNEKGDVTLSFSADETKKIKWILVTGGAAIALSFCSSLYSTYSMSSLTAENRLYQNQLKLAEEKMGKIEEKVENIEKISDELQNLVGGNRASGGAELKGQGGGHTVPDIAKKGKPETVKNPGDLLSEMAWLDEELNKDMKVMVELRASLLEGGYSAGAGYGAGAHVTPSGWPVEGEISSEFGWRVSPAGIGSSYHEGIDISTNYNVPVRVTADGTVTRAGWEDGGYGYLVEVRHENGIVTRYGHNSAVVVYEGQRLHKGDTVALAGSTGNSTGPHCHYEVRVHGDSVDPRAYLGE